MNVKQIPLILLLASLPAVAADGLLNWMDRTAQLQLDARAAEIAAIRTPEAAKARQALVREKVLQLLGGFPKTKGPLNAKVHRTLDRGRFLIEMVTFESMPRLVVSANLYRPKEAGKHPAVLFAMGHWIEGKVAAQRMAANLALKGFVVLVYDPIGQGERQEAYDARLGASLAGGSVDQHLLAGGQAIAAGESFARYRIWDGVRALDYLESRPEVDAARIGCTGCSGGGTLTTYISALDARVKVAAPSCYINTFRLLFSGPTGDSEQSLPGFLSSGLDLPDYIELFAPKPWLITNTIADFFPLEGARQAYEESRRFYRVLGAEERVAWTIGPGGHGTPETVREAVYGWMLRWLGDGKGSATEESVELLPPFELAVTAAGITGSRPLHEIIAEGFRERAAPGDATQMLAALRAAAGLAEQRPPAVRVLQDDAAPAGRVQQIVFESEPGIDLKATLHVPSGRGRKPALLAIAGAEVDPAALAAAGNVVLVVSPRGWPSNASGYRLAGDWITRACSHYQNITSIKCL